MVLENFLVDADILWDRAGKELYEKPEARAGRKMRVRVTNKGVVDDLTGYTLNLGWKSTSDETKFGLDAFDVVDATEGLYELDYTSGMLTNIGNLKVVLQLVPLVGEPTESNNFMITVKKSALDPEAVQSETSFTALALALVNVNAWNATISGKVIDWEADMAETKQLYIDNMNEVELTYPQALLSVEQQLAHKIGGGVKAEPEDLSATTLGLVTGAGGPINLLSIPQDSSVTPTKTDFLDYDMSPNLLDLSAVNYGYIDLSGNIQTSATLIYSDPIPVVEGETVRYQFDYNGVRYDSGNNVISGGVMRYLSKYGAGDVWQATIDQPATYLVESGVAFVRVVIKADHLTVGSAWSKPAIVIGATTDIIPFYGFGKEINVALKPSVSLPDGFVKDDSIGAEQVDFIKPANFLDVSKSVVGAFMDTAGVVTSPSTLNYSEKIKVRNDKYYKITYNAGNGQRKLAEFRFVTVFDANENLISKPSSSINQQLNTFRPYDIDQKTEWVVVTYKPSDYGLELMIEEFDTADVEISNVYRTFGTQSLDDSLVVNQDNYPKALQLKNTTVNAGGTTSLPLSNIGKNNTISAIVTFSTFQKMRIGRGYNNYLGSWVEVTATQLIVHKYESSDVVVETYTHGLTFDTTFGVVINVKDSTAQIVLFTSTGKVEYNDVPWRGKGAPFSKNDGTGAVTVDLSFFASDATKDIWFFGDSYMGFTSTNRWMYYPITYGYDNFLVDAQGGANSNTEYTSFLTDLTIYKPKYVVWCLGMNDGADSGGVPSATWKTNVDKLLAVCKKYHITPVVATIPSVPTLDHSAKNTFVRTSGVRYIDFAKAVESGIGDKNWKTGMLDVDGIHPTEIGAFNLFLRAMVDFPELTTR